MSIGEGKPYRFKPSRRKFVGRGRIFLTWGEWKIALFSLSIGGALGCVIAVGYFLDGKAIGRDLGRDFGGAIALVQSQQREPAVQQVAQVAAQTTPLAVSLTSAEPANVGRYYIAQAARIVDGATFDLEGVAIHVRLWGVDAPESDEEGFAAAAAKLRELVTGETLACTEIERDGDGGIVARCYSGSGADISEAMIKSGAALEYIRYTDGYYSGI